MKITPPAAPSGFSRNKRTRKWITLLRSLLAGTTGISVTSAISDISPWDQLLGVGGEQFDRFLRHRGEAGRKNQFRGDLGAELGELRQLLADAVRIFWA